MKWFKHDVDMTLDLKIQEVLAQHGLEGYAIWCMTLELLGREAPESAISCIKRVRNWKKALLFLSQIKKEARLDKILETFAKIGLIDRNAFKKGDLYIPKFASRVDEYTQRKLGRISGQNPVTVPYYKIRRDKIRRDKRENRDLIPKNDEKTERFSAPPLKEAIKNSESMKQIIERIGIKV